MIIHTIFAASSLSNIYLISNEEHELLIVDPAENRDEMIQYIEEKHLKLKGVLLSHLHKSHIAGLLTLEKIYPSPFYSMVKAYNDHSIRIESEKPFEIGSFIIEAIPIRGHSDDSAVYKIDNALFTGDTLYAGKIASTDSIMKREHLIKDINDKIMTLDENMLIFPGHGPTSKIRIEKMFNIDLISSQASYL